MRTRVTFGLVAWITASGCTADTFEGGGTDNPPVGGNDGGAQPDVAPPPGCDGHKLPTDDPCVVNDAEGIFVSSSKGAATGDGTRATPIQSLVAGIAAAKRGGKRVYACAESYPESITLQDGVSVFGYFDCNSWSIGSAHAMVRAPESPAASASNITTPTRVEAVDFVAPDFDDKSQSSIGLVVIASPALTIVHATVHAGTGGKGDDGTDGIQLTDSGNAKNGASAWQDGVCTSGFLCLPYYRQPAGGTNACTGEAGHDGGPGGLGGYPGKFTSAFFYNGYVWDAQDQGTTVGDPTTATSQTAQGGALGASGSPGTPGADGTDGVNGANVGVISGTGYIPSDGTGGLSGAPGQGGGGSGGYNSLQNDYPANNYQGKAAWGEPGAGGGAGGCPGLASQPGKGGGASVAIVAVASGFVLDTVVIESSAGGHAGASGAPSVPTPGGLGGHKAKLSLDAGKGGDGGHAGVSGNGGGGPAIGLAYQGTEPTLLASTIKAGVGGVGVAERVVNGQTIPSSPDGLSKDRYSF